MFYYVPESAMPIRSQIVVTPVMDSVLPSGVKNSDLLETKDREINVKTQKIKAKQGCIGY